MVAEHKVTKDRSGESAPSSRAIRGTRHSRSERSTLPIGVASGATETVAYPYARLAPGSRRVSVCELHGTLSTEALNKSEWTFTEVCGNRFTDGVIDLQQATEKKLPKRGERTCVICASRAIYGQGCFPLRTPPEVGEWYCREHVPDSFFWWRKDVA